MKILKLLVTEIISVIIFLCSVTAFADNINVYTPIFDSDKYTDLTKSPFHKENKGFSSVQTTSSYTGNEYIETVLTPGGSRISFYADGNNGECEQLSSDNITLTTWFKWNELFDTKSRTSSIFSLNDGSTKDIMAVYYNAYGTLIFSVSSYDKEGRCIGTQNYGTAGGEVWAPSFDTVGGNANISAYSGTNQYIHIAVTRSYNSTKNSYSYSVYVNSIPVPIAVRGENVYSTTQELILSGTPDRAYEKCFTLGRSYNTDTGGTNCTGTSFIHTHVYNNCLSHDEINKVYMNQRKDFFGNLAFEFGKDNVDTVKASVLINKVTYERLKLSDSSSLVSSPGINEELNLECEFYEIAEDYITISDINVINEDFTLQMWITPKTQDNQKSGLFEISDDEKSSFSVLRNGADLLLSCVHNTVKNSITIPNVLPHEKWTHVAITRCRDTQSEQYIYQIYINAECIKTVSFEGELYDESAMNVYINRAEGLSSTALYTEAAIYTEALNSSEILKHYNKKVIYVAMYNSDGRLEDCDKKAFYTCFDGSDIYLEESFGEINIENVCYILCWNDKMIPLNDKHLIKVGYNKIYIDEDFSDGISKNWELAADAVFAAGDGVLSLEESSGGILIGDEWYDYDVCADIALLEDEVYENQVYIYGRYRKFKVTGDQYYKVGFDGTDTVSITKHSQGRTTTLASAAIETVGDGIVRKLRVRFLDDVITLFINDEEILSATDPAEPILEGSPGIFVAGAKGSIDNFKVKEIYDLYGGIYDNIIRGGFSVDTVEVKNVCY